MWRIGMKDFTLVIIAAIIGVVVITYKALDMGINDALLKASFTAIGGLVGSALTYFTMKRIQKNGSTT